MYRTILAFAKKSKLNNIHPVEKIVLSIFPIIILGFFNNITTTALNILFFTIIHIYFKNPGKVVLKFTLGIAAFSSISCITFIFDYGLYYCFAIVLKSISGGLGLAFLVLTTPLDDMLYLFSKSELLRDVCDIVKSMERFLVLIEDEYSLLYRGMKARGGFDSYRKK
jgi:cobalt/nickel transport system permease protein